MSVTLTFNGDMSGHEYYEIGTESYMVKVSDRIFTAEEFAGFSFHRIYTDGTERDSVYDSIYLYENNGSFNYGNLIMSGYSGVTVGGFTNTSDGTFLRYDTDYGGNRVGFYVSSITFANAEAEETWLYNGIELPPLPEDRYTYNMIVRTSDGQYGLYSGDKPFDYIYSDTTDLYSDKYWISSSYNGKVYILQDNEWILAMDGYFEDGVNQLQPCDGWAMWAGYALPQYVSADSSAPDNCMWIVDSVTVNGVTYECSDYLPYEGGSSGGGGTEPDNPSGGGTTETPNTNSAFMMGYMVGKALRLSR